MHTVERSFGLKENILILLVALAATSLAFLPLCKASANLAVYGYTDKPFYRPGDTGTLNLWVYNSGTEDLILKNVTIHYPWFNPVGLWEGNVTITPSTAVVIAVGGNWSTTSSFTVPNDGRVSAGSSSISINVVTDKTTQSSYILMGVASVPNYYSLQNMDQLLNWLMILVVAIVVCTLIIAAAIFISVHRRQMMWKPGETPR
jgi:uncharacterized membrane protein